MLIAIQLATIFSKGKELKATTYDVLGYYLYVPSFTIYDDCKDLGWYTELEKKYNLQGSDFYQARRAANGNHVFTYYGGLSLFYLPFFLLGHIIALLSNFPADGFSYPYQLCIFLSPLFYIIPAIFLLRKFLKHYYSDVAVAWSLILGLTATNFVQYATIDGNQTHAYLFVLYVLVLWYSRQWHLGPTLKNSFLLGLITGFAIFCRPTEAIMLFIPLLWISSGFNKWKFVKEDKRHIWLVIAGGTLALLPQFLYWQHATDQWIYDVGSKWYFLYPYFRVLFGWEKGWFIYTPATLLFVAGLWYMRGKVYRKSVLSFCLLNLWIIMAWSDWRYGGSYSCRALVQSYPVFILALSGLIASILQSRYRKILYVLVPILVFVNLFQHVQYNKTILHYRGMNKLYYQHVFLDLSPTPLDMSLMYSDLYLSNFEDYPVSENYKNTTAQKIQGENVFIRQEILQSGTKNEWAKIKLSVKAQKGFWNSNLVVETTTRATPLSFPLFNAISKEDKINTYEFFVKLDTTLEPNIIEIKVDQKAFIGTLEQWEIQVLKTSH